VDAIETKACPRTPGGVRASVVLCEYLDVLVAFAAVDLVLNAEVGEVDAIVEYGSSCSAAHWRISSSERSGRPSLSDRLAVVLLQELLILPLQLLFEHDAVDIDVVLPLSKTGFFFAIRGIQPGVVIQFAWAVYARVELLGSALVARSPIGFEQVPALLREDDGLVIFAQCDGPNQTFVTQVVQRVVVRVPVASEITLGDDSERTDGRQGTAVLAIQFVDSVAVDH
jgi:hypothetical protein